MSGHPSQRRQTNVGSILLTPQENEYIFNYLGRKCIVSFFFPFLPLNLGQAIKKKKKQKLAKRSYLTALLAAKSPPNFITCVTLKMLAWFVQQHRLGPTTMSLVGKLTFKQLSCQLGPFAGNLRLRLNSWHTCVTVARGEMKWKGETPWGIRMWPGEFA